ncbi:MAG: hypothetical protein IPK70_04520 [Flavobacteriales bacterium]|nr:hypothetical protein [Flavobacteriales bacterium]
MPPRTQHLLLRLLLALGVWGSALTGAAQIDTVALQFRHRSIKDGLSQGMVNWIMQDNYGFMWFATKDGLNRYDGYTFTVYRHDPSDSTTVRNSYTNVLLEDSKGRLWVGTSSGLDLFDRQREEFIHLPCLEAGAILRTTRTEEVMSGCGCTDVQEDPAGNIWVTTNRGLTRVEVPASGPLDPERVTMRTVLPASDWTRATIDRAGVLRGHVRDQFAFAIDTRDKALRLDTIRLDRPDKYEFDGSEFPRTDILVVEDTVHNKLYGVNPYGVTQIDPATNRSTTLREFPELRILVIPYRIALDADGRIWLPAQGGLMLRFDPADSSITRISTEASDIRPVLEFVKCSYRDRNGLIWLGTTGYGLLTYDPRVDRFNPVTGNSVRYMAPMRDGRLLLNESNFLTIYDPVRHRRVFSLADLRAETVNFRLYPGTEALAPDAAGAIWFTAGGLGRYDPERRVAEQFIPPLPSGQLAPPSQTCFPFEVTGDTLWFGAAAFHWFDLRTREFGLAAYPIPPVNEPYNFLQAIHRDAQGILWLGTLKGLLRFDLEARAWKHFTHEPKNAETLAADILFCIAADPNEPDRYLWIGTMGGGLCRFEKSTGIVKRFTTAEGLPNNVVYGILPDDDGRLWMSTNKGIARFDPRTQAFRNFVSGDGLQDDEFNRNAFARLADGTLCFGGINGFNVFDPRELKEDSTAHVIRITAVKLLNRDIDFRAAGAPLSTPPYMSSGMRIPYAANMVTFEFATLEFAAPEEHRYQYMLEGFDPDWVMAGNARSAVYTNLDPGTYTFRVRGDNRDGVWDTVGTSFTLEVLPPWWKTWWFYTLCAAFVIGGVVFYIVSLERTVRLRSLELEQEKERSEALLRNILPADVANELKDTGNAAARHFDRATILFAHLEGLAQASDQMSARELVQELNTCFIAFDGIVAAHGVEKIKTIGHSYLCAGGLPDPDRGSPIEVVKAALEMQDFMTARAAQRATEGKPAIGLRIGIHTGPIVAGIVGVKKFQYDIWGDAVNVASRMESTGEAGKVNISEETYALVKVAQDGGNGPNPQPAIRQHPTGPALHFTPRGRLPVKGKGEIGMYFVERG